MSWRLLWWVSSYTKSSQFHTITDCINYSWLELIVTCNQPDSLMSSIVPPNHLSLRSMTLFCSTVLPGQWQYYVTKLLHAPVCLQELVNCTYLLLVGVCWEDDLLAGAIAMSVYSRKDDINIFKLSKFQTLHLSGHVFPWKSAVVGFAKMKNA